MAVENYESESLIDFSIKYNNNSYHEDTLQILSDSSFSQSNYAIDGQAPSTSKPNNDEKLFTRWENIKSNTKIVKLYTGCPSYKVFEFIVEHVRPKHSKLQYYRGSKSNNETKQYQESPFKLFSQKKPGPSRTLNLKCKFLSACALFS